MIEFLDPVPAYQHFCCDDCLKPQEKDAPITPYREFPNAIIKLVCAKCAGLRQRGIKLTEPKDAGLAVTSRATKTRKH